MTDKEYFNHIAAALIACADGCAKYMQKNPNAKYNDPNGKERPISFAIDSIRKHAQALKEAADDAAEKP